MLLVRVRNRASKSQKQIEQVVQAEMSHCSLADVGADEEDEDEVKSSRGAKRKADEDQPFLMR